MNNITTETISGGIKYLNELYLNIATKVVVVLAILLIGFVIGRLLGKLTQKALHGIGLNTLTAKMGIGLSLEGLFGNIIAYMVYFTTILIALNKLGLTTTILNIMAAGIIILAILLVVLSLKDTLPNAFAGFLIKQKGLIKEGDVITVQKRQGKIKKINITETLIETKDEDIYIPNSILIKEEVTKKKS